MKELVSKVSANYFKALGHPTRLKILEFLKNRERCVCEIGPALKIKQANLSQHLALLKKAGLVLDRKDGLSVFYKVKDKRIFKVFQLVHGMIRQNLKESGSLLKIL